mmetsp:Transcript_20341/g.42427  ORF Transcript_20341/g.42427 Transcript_20341/m.42427 type:complete len:429 (-) Transcript_20341:800-2086(-)
MPQPLATIAALSTRTRRLALPSVALLSLRHALVFLSDLVPPGVVRPHDHLFLASLHLSLDGPVLVGVDEVDLVDLAGAVAAVLSDRLSPEKAVDGQQPRQVVPDGENGQLVPVEGRPPHAAESSPRFVVVVAQGPGVDQRGGVLLLVVVLDGVGDTDPGGRDTRHGRRTGDTDGDLFSRAEVVEFLRGARHEVSVVVVVLVGPVLLDPAELVVAAAAADAPGLVPDGHHRAPVDDDDVIGLVFLRGLLEELLVQQVPDGTPGGRPGDGRPREVGPLDPRRGDLVPPRPVGPENRVLVLDVPGDLPVLVGVPEGEAVPLLVLDVPAVGPAAGKAVDRQPALHVVLDLDLGDLAGLEGGHPVAVPSLRPLLSLVLVVEVHSTDAHGGPGKGPDDGPRLPGGLGAPDLGHGRLDFPVLDGVDDVDDLAGLL